MTDSASRRRLWTGQFVGGNEKSKAPPRLSVAFVIVAIVLFSSLAGFLVRGLVERDEGIDRDDYVHEYILQVFPDTLDNYSVLCPIPINRDTRLPSPDFPENIGSDNPLVTLSIESTAYGKALRLSGRGDVNVTWERHYDSDDGDLYDSLSMLSTYDYHASSALLFIELEGMNVGVSIDYYVKYAEKGDYLTYDSNIVMIDAGWHQDSVRITSVVYG